jgi:hypothetical protein
MASNKTVFVIGLPVADLIALVSELKPLTPKFKGAKVAP